MSVECFSRANHAPSSDNTDILLICYHPPPDDNATLGPCGVGGWGRVLWLGCGAARLAFSVEAFNVWGAAASWCSLRAWCVSWVWGVGVRVQGSWVWGVGVRVQGSACRVLTLEGWWVPRKRVPNTTRAQTALCLIHPPALELTQIVRWNSSYLTLPAARICGAGKVDGPKSHSTI